MLLGFYLLSVVALPAALGAFVIFSGLPRGRRCPACSGETLQIRSRPHSLASRVVRDDLHRRWCPACAWSGTTRLARAPAPVVLGAPDRATTVVSPAPTASAAPAKPGAPAGVGIRRVEIDGDDWQVQVQCWAEGPTWRGRLIFVGPAGRAWCEHDAGLVGGSALEVLSVALSLPEPALVGRIRKASRR